MKLKYERQLKDGRRHVLLELAKGEAMPVQAIDPDKNYRLAYPMEDQVYAGHIIADPVPVVWDTFEQRWIE